MISARISTQKRCGGGGGAGKGGRGEQGWRLCVFALPGARGTLRNDLAAVQETTFDITADMTRQYKAMQEELLGKINDLQTTINSLKDDLGAALAPPCLMMHVLHCLLVSVRGARASFAGCVTVVGNVLCVLMV